MGGMFLPMCRTPNRTDHGDDYYLVSYILASVKARINKNKRYGLCHLPWVETELTHALRHLPWVETELTNFYLITRFKFKVENVIFLRSYFTVTHDTRKAMHIYV